MSVPQQKLNPEKSVRQRTTGVKEPMQHAGDVFYGAMGPPALESTHPDSGGSAAVFNPEKEPQGRVHYQPTAKWMHQEPVQAQGWSREAPVQAWSQEFGPYMGGVNNVRAQMAFPKGSHDGGALQMGAEKQAPGSMEGYREAAQAQARGLEWEHANAAMHQAQLQAFQQGHKGVDGQGQPHAPSHAVPGSMLQPFQLAFGPTKQHLPSGYYQVYTGSKGMPNLSYGEQPKSQHQMMQLQQQMQQHQMHQQQQQQQQQLQHHHHHHQQQQRHQLQHQHQMQQQQIQKQQLHMQQYHQQQLQQIHQRQQQQQPLSLPQKEGPQPQMQQKQHQNTPFLSYQAPDSCPSSASPPPQQEGVFQSMETQALPEEREAQLSDASFSPDSCPQKEAGPSDAPQVLPRRSRRLSREGLSPLGGPPSLVPWNQASREPPGPQNGQVAVGDGVRAGETQAASGGVIQSTRRRRRASKEINLETLAQKASEMESLPAKMAKQEEGSLGRQASMVPLVIPVSVPVRLGQGDPPAVWPHGHPTQRDPLPHPEHKPSVIVARRRSLRNSLSDGGGQDGDSDAGQEDDGRSSKAKRRPRPEPLFIPPPKPATFIAPSVYSSITPYQSHLRSPVRLPDPLLCLPPYTPPPILSPVRDGSGLYFSTFLSSIAAGNQSLPPPATPKSASRSLLRSSTSTDVTPPLLPLNTDPTLVSSEPRINIGPQYQAEVPELCERPVSQPDPPRAELVWAPIQPHLSRHAEQERVDDLMNLACSSVLCGGGTNQELALHCLQECRGDVLEALAVMLLKEPVFSKGHPLADYHYSGSDSWTPAEKRYFNKGISAYRKDFFMVQKLVQTKTVAQCVEFYYTFKKQVKIGRNGALTYGPPEALVERGPETTLEVKSSQLSKLSQEEGDNRKWEGSCDQSQDGRPGLVSQTLQPHENTGPVLVPKEGDVVSRVVPAQFTSPPAARRPRPESAGKKSRSAPKPPLEPEGVFPCKKCSRVFYKVKSRSAHMKSHSEQEKKAAALRQKEEAERAAAALAAEEARAREAAEAALEAAGNTSLGGEAEREELSGREESSEPEDDEDEDWH